MILKSTKIAGDLKIAKGKHIYVSGSVQAPPLAILEDSDIPLNESVVFSVEDATPGTIKTSGTTITDSSITAPDKSTCYFCSFCKRDIDNWYNYRDAAIDCYSRNYL